MRNKILGSIAFSTMLIMLAVFSVSFHAAVVKADDSGGEVCRTTDSYTEGKCACKYYSCTVWAGMQDTRAGFGCYIGDSTISVYGYDSSIGGGKDTWGDISGCFSTMND